MFHKTSSDIRLGQGALGQGAFLEKKTCTRKDVSVIFAQVNIEVARGHQRSILTERHIIFLKMYHYLRTYYRQQAAEKTLESPFEAISLTCRQN